jgi:hypothetical protein
MLQSLVSIWVNSVASTPMDECNSYYSLLLEDRSLNHTQKNKFNRVLEHNHAKDTIMECAKHKDFHIRENALLALQKIMLHNW